MYQQAGIEKMYGMFFAVGLVARGVKFSRSPVKQVGITGNSYTFLIMLHSVITALIGIFTGRHHADWKPVTMTLTETDGKIHQGTFLFALISASHRILLNMRPYWGKRSAAFTCHLGQATTQAALAFIVALINGARR